MGMNTTQSIKAQYVVTSCNFSWHAPIACDTYPEALAAAKSRGFEARIQFGTVSAIERGLHSELVATWSPLYGVHTYNHSLANR